MQDYPAQRDAVACDVSAISRDLYGTVAGRERDRESKQPGTRRKELILAVAGVECVCLRPTTPP